MRFGCSTMFFGELEVCPSLEAISEAGYDSAEIWVEHLALTGEDPRVIAGKARSLGLGLTVHAPFTDLNIVSKNAGIRDESLRQVRDSISLAGQLGSGLIVVHPGRLSSSRDRMDDVWRRFLDCVSLLDTWSEGVVVAVEMMEKRSREFFLTPDDARRVMKQDLPHICLTVDVAHLATIGDPAGLLEELDPSWIAHVHLSQSRPDRTHAPLGEGLIDIPGVLALLEKSYDGIVSLEGYSPGRGEELAVSNISFLRELGYAT